MELLSKSLGKSLYLEKGELLFSQGSVGEKFYIIEEGKVELQFDGRTRKFLEKGDFFGEISSLTRLRRTATAVAATECKLKEYTREELLELMKLSKFSGAIQEKFRTRLLHFRTRLDQVHLEMNENLLLTFLAHFEERKIAKDEVICTEGEEASGIFFILRGSISVRKGEQVIARRGPGEFIGEIGAVRGTPRIANAVAEQESEILECRTEVLRQLLKEHRDFDQYLHSLASKRILNTPS